MVVTWGRIFSSLTLTQEEDGPTRPALFLHTFIHLHISIQPSRQCGSVFSYLFFSLLVLPFSFIFLGNSTDEGSPLPPVLCNGHVRNACSLLAISSEESSHGLCANEWKLYSNKTLFIDLNISF